MELVAFVMVLLMCLGLAKIVNAVLKRRVVNGAAIYLLLALVYVGWNVVLASGSGLAPFDKGHVFGQSVAPALMVGLIALYFCFKFRSDKAHEVRVRKLREQRARDDV